ncbi:MAG: hypothetical protein ACLQRH_16270 [Acidimicrobiales bacterium]
MDVVLDDRLLIEELLVGLHRRGAQLHTTSYWYYRACHAAVAGAGGHLSGPFRDLPLAKQQRAVTSMLQLPEEIGLPQPRDVVPIMVSVAGRHPRLNVLNLEAVATARWLGATVWLSPEGASGMLPDVLGAEGLTWETITPS